MDCPRALLGPFLVALVLRLSPAGPFVYDALYCSEFAGAADNRRGSRSICRSSSGTGRRPPGSASCSAPSPSASGSRTRRTPPRPPRSRARRAPCRRRRLRLGRLVAAAPRAGAPRRDDRPRPPAHRRPRSHARCAAPRDRRGPAARLGARLRPARRDRAHAVGRPAHEPRRVDPRHRAARGAHHAALSQNADQTSGDLFDNGNLREYYAFFQVMGGALVLMLRFTPASTASAPSRARWPSCSRDRRQRQRRGGWALVL